MALDANKIRLELEKVGIYINDIYDLVNSKESYPLAIPVLLDLLVEGIVHPGIKEGVIRALAVKEAVGKANAVLIDEYHKTPVDKMALRWAIGNTVYTTITPEFVDPILTIVQDPANGISRQMFVAALGKIKSDLAEAVLIQLLDDEQVTPHALEALGRMKSLNAKERITMLTHHPNALISKEAKKALKKLL